MENAPRCQISRLRTAVLQRKNQLVRPTRFAALLMSLLLAMPACVAQDQAAGPSRGSKISSVARPAEIRVDLNHATVSELMTVSGISRTWANRIVRFRPYFSKQDLLDRGVVNSQVYDRIKDHVIAHRDKP